MEKTKRFEEMVSPSEDFQRVANRVSYVSIAGNIALSVLKLIAGLWAHSAAMVSDAVHSASDIFSTLIVMLGIKLASKEPDKEHPYGHERLECVGTVMPGICHQSARINLFGMVFGILIHYLFADDGYDCGSKREHARNSDCLVGTGKDGAQRTDADGKTGQ